MFLGTDCRDTPTSTAAPATCAADGDADVAPAPPAAAVPVPAPAGPAAPAAPAAASNPHSWAPIPTTAMARDLSADSAVMAITDPSAEGRAMSVALGSSPPPSASTSDAATDPNSLIARGRTTDRPVMEVKRRCRASPSRSGIESSRASAGTVQRSADEDSHWLGPHATPPTVAVPARSADRPSQRPTSTTSSPGAAVAGVTPVTAGGHSGSTAAWGDVTRWPASGHSTDTFSCAGRAASSSPGKIPRSRSKPVTVHPSAVSFATATSTQSSGPTRMPDTPVRAKPRPVSSTLAFTAAASLPLVAAAAGTGSHGSASPLPG
mmetsp:Transcript_3014/g.12367  ORF Transcript_3014/g.12367 Transcript_3014/m.12367 type:complete len:321 (-) Transcript_3014:345-1307(-)